ncbi:polysaccharide lyase family 14 protein [Plicaturopsis crispa FD-325 SS-3]|nr:polysaccharide lyase family 14 protein [Plicaturopsis crispa FD-325 SS-3]
MAQPKYTAALTFVLLCASPALAASSTSAAALASQYSLTTSTSLPFPTATQTSSDAQALMVSQWSLSKGKIQNGADDLSFVDDPFPSSSTPGTSSLNTTSPVLQVTYPAGSYSHDTGGTQLYSLWNTTDGSVFQSMVLSYEVAFDKGFDWVKGGKLPGLRGGPDPNGCSGGSQPNGSDCFSSRVMWRTGGAGEVYAYLLEPDSLCGDSKDKSVICNSDFGVSFDRGSFTLQSGQWNRITMLVQLNNPPSSANGKIMLLFNDAPVVSHQNLQLRNSTDIDVGGLYLSTFFGGSDTTWETPTTTHTYFRNFQLWGGSSASNGTSTAVNGAIPTSDWNSWFVCLTVALFSWAVGL